MQGKGTSRDLLDLEHKNLFSSSSSALESALLVCKDKKKKKKKSEEAPSRPTIGPVPKSQFHDKLKGFLGEMAESNKKLEEKARENPEAFDIEAFDIEAVIENPDIEAVIENPEAFDIEVTEDESRFIEMDLMVGVADLNTPEAVSAAEAAIAGNGLTTKSGGSSSDESDSDEDEEEKESSLGEECIRKRTKIIELS